VRELEVGSETYRRACEREAAYWGEEVRRAAAQGIPFSADMRRAQRIRVNRGPGLPQLQSYDPEAERIMNGALYSELFGLIRSFRHPARILVLTCGAGGLCLELARLGHRVHGVDISPGAIEIARRYARDNPFRESFGALAYSIADLNTFEIDSAYDVVVAWDGLHHILRLDRLLSGIARALEPGGLFIFSDNIGMHWRSRLLGGLLYLILPTRVSYLKKISYTLGGEEKIRREMSERSPFEEISAGQIVSGAERYFEITRRTAHTGVGYRAALAGDLRAPDRLRYPFLRLLKRMDDWAVKNALLRGDHVFVVARPRTSS